MTSGTLLKSEELTLDHHLSSTLSRKSTKIFLETCSSEGQPKETHCPDVGKPVKLNTIVWTCSPIFCQNLSELMSLFCGTVWDFFLLTQSNFLFAVIHPEVGHSIPPQG